MRPFTRGWRVCQLNPPKATTELLYEDPSTVGDPGEGEDVHVRDVDAFVEDVDRSEDRDAAGAEVQQPLLTFPHGHVGV